MTPIEEIEEVLQLKSHFPDIDFDLIILAFNRIPLKSISLTSRLRRYGIVKMNYQELEFFGDEILGIVVKNLMLDYYNITLNAKQMTSIQSQFVSNKNLIKVAHDIGIAKYIKVKNEKDYADVIEAILGALHLHRYDTFQIAKWFLQLPTIKENSILFNNPEITGLEKVSSEINIETVLTKDITEVFDEHVSIPEPQITQDTTLKSKNERKKNDDLSQEDFMGLPPVTPMIFEDNVIYPSNKIMKGVLQGIILELGEKEGFYSNYQNFQIVLTWSDLRYYFNSVFYIMIHFNEDKVSICNIDSLRKRISHARRQVKNDLIKSINIKSGRIDAYNKLYPNAPEGWYGVYIEFEVSFPYFDDGEIGYYIDKPYIQNNECIFENESVRAELKKYLSQKGITKRNNDVSFARFLGFPTKNSTVKITLIVSLCTPYKTFYEANEEMFFKSIKNLRELVFTANNIDKSLFDRSNTFRLSTPLLIVGDQFGVAEVLTLSNRSISESSFEAIKHLLPEVDFSNMIIEKNQEVSTDNYFKEQLEYIKINYGIKFIFGKRPLLSKLRSSTYLGYYFNLTEGDKIYEITITPPYNEEYFNQLTNNEVLSNEKIAAKMNTLHMIFGVKNLPFKRINYQYISMVSPFQFLQKRSTTPIPLSELI